MGSIRSFYFLRTSAVRMLIGMGTERDRVISITLSESEWQAFIARQPQPVQWLRERIRDEAQAPAAEQRTQSAA
jgi:hypothetical protein